MIGFNKFIVENKPRLVTFLEKISDIPQEEAIETPKAEISQKEYLTALSVIVRYMKESLDMMEKEFDSDPRMNSGNQQLIVENKQRFAHLKSILSEAT